MKSKEETENKKKNFKKTQKIRDPCAVKPPEREEREKGKEANSEAVMTGHWRCGPLGLRDSPYSHRKQDRTVLVK